MVLLCSLTGCGGGSEPKAEESSSLPNVPRCEDVWVISQKLPEDYRGCIRSKKVVARQYLNCGLDGDKASDGTALLYWYEDGLATYYAWGNDTKDPEDEWTIEDGNEIVTNPAYAGTDLTVLDIAQQVCRE